MGSSRTSPARAARFRAPKMGTASASAATTTAHSAFGAMPCPIIQFRTGWEPVQTRAAMQGRERARVLPLPTGDVVRAYRSALRTVGRDGPLVVACLGIVALGVALRV